jgi:phospholipase/carboxylesterase
VTDLVHRLRPSSGDPAGALVLLHGRGADEYDLFPLLDMLDPDRRLTAITPRGPLSLPPGGAHWYRVREIGYPDPETFLPTFAAVSSWLDRLPDLTGAPLERTVIGGFSQGAVMSYALSLAAGRPSPAAIIALSGFVPTVDGFPLDLDRPGLPVAIGHGTLDPVIGVEWGRDARDRLEAAELAVQYRESPIGHTIEPRFLAELPSFVAAALSG